MHRKRHQDASEHSSSVLRALRSTTRAGDAKVASGEISHFRISHVLTPLASPAAWTDDRERPEPRGLGPPGRARNFDSARPLDDSALLRRAEHLSGLLVACGSHGRPAPTHTGLVRRAVRPTLRDRAQTAAPTGQRKASPSSTSCPSCAIPSRFVSAGTMTLTQQFESLLTAFMSHIFVSVLPRTPHRSVAIALAR